MGLFCEFATLRINGKPRVDTGFPRASEINRREDLPLSAHWVAVPSRVNFSIPAFAKDLTVRRSAALGGIAVSTILGSHSDMGTKLKKGFISQTGASTAA